MRRIGQEILIQGIVDVMFVTILLDYVVDLLKLSLFYRTKPTVLCGNTGNWEGKGRNGAQ